MVNLVDVSELSIAADECLNISLLTEHFKDLLSLFKLLAH